MEAVFFLLSMLGAGLIMWWVIENDGVGPTEPTRGLLAMPGDLGENQSADKATKPALPATLPPRPL